MTPPLPEPKPVVTLYSTELHIESRWVGHLLDDGYDRPNDGRPIYLNAAFTTAELRAIADWLDQWQDATLLSEVGE